MSGGRIALAVLALAGAAVLVVALLPAGGPDAPVPPVRPPGGNGDVTVQPVGKPRPRFTDPAQCRACHAEVYDEWDASMHRQAWTDPQVRLLSEDFRDTTCLSCHVPQPIHFGPVGSRVFERTAGFESGVDCLSCHLLPDGGVAARRDLPEAPCAPRAVATLGEAETCQGCHNQHGLVDEWRSLYRNPDPAAGALLTEPQPRTCVDCHADPVERPGGRTGRSHVFPGGHWPEVLRRGLALEARVEGARVSVNVTNGGTGHRAPGDSRHRSFNVWVTVTTEAGLRVFDRHSIAEYRMYPRVPPRPHTNLRPGETATSGLDLPSGVAGTVKVELGYSLSPVDRDARVYTVVHARELPFDTR